MYAHLVSLASVLALFLSSSGWTASSQPLPPAEGTEVAPAAMGKMKVTGELRFYRHIDPVTHRGAVAVHVDGKDIPLDFRQFNLDIQLWQGGLYVIQGHWSKEQRLVVTQCSPTGSQEEPRVASSPEVHPTEGRP